MKSADLYRLCPPFRAVSLPKRALALQRLTSQICQLSAVTPARGLDITNYNVYIFIYKYVSTVGSVQTPSTCVTKFSKATVVVACPPYFGKKKTRKIIPGRVLSCVLCYTVCLRDKGKHITYLYIWAPSLLLAILGKRFARLRAGLPRIRHRKPCAPMAQGSHPGRAPASM